MANRPNWLVTFTADIYELESLNINEDGMVVDVKT